MFPKRCQKRCPSSKNIVFGGFCVAIIVAEPTVNVYQGRNTIAEFSRISENIIAEHCSYPRTSKEIRPQNCGCYRSEGVGTDTHGIQSTG